MFIQMKKFIRDFIEILNKIEKYCIFAKENNN